MVWLNNFKFLGFLFLVQIFTAFRIYTQIEAGPLFGVNRSSTMIHANNIQRTSYPGWMAGLFLRIGGKAFAEVSPLYVSVAEVAAAHDRFGHPDDPDSPPVKGRLAAGYMQIPVVASIKAYQTDDLNFHLGMGGSFSLLTGLRDNPFNLHKEDFRKTDVSVIGKIGMDFNRFVVDVQYSYGFSSRIHHVDSKMQIFSFIVAYKIWGYFPLRRTPGFFPG